MKEGWGWPINSRKMHYFRHKVSLCGNWMYWGHVLENDVIPYPDNCKECERERIKELKRKERDGY